MVTRGKSIEAQAWTARRCVSLFNDICRRPHVPREVEIRDLIRELNIKLPERHEEDPIDGCTEEGSESEEATEDEPVDLPLGSLKYMFV